MTTVLNARFVLWAIGTLAAGLIVGSAYADAPIPAEAASSDAPAGNAPREPLELQEIVVTGDRKNTYSADLVQAGSFRGARQLDTPLTVAVIPQEVIQSQQAIDLLDAIRNTAGVTSSNLGPTVYNNIAIRGIVVDTRSNFRLDGSLPILSSIAFPDAVAQAPWRKRPAIYGTCAIISLVLRLARRWLSINTEASWCRLASNADRMARCSSMDACTRSTP
jgi:outer membrane receptor protein involved in Fe transport